MTAESKCSRLGHRSPSFKPSIFINCDLQCDKINYCHNVSHAAMFLFIYLYCFSIRNFVIEFFNKGNLKKKLCRELVVH